jgi:P pilus assembly chaperone PapD
VTLTLTNDATLTWSWSTNYWLDTATNGPGSVDVADQWIASGSNVTVNAATAAHYHFTTWSGDTNGCTIAGTQITVPMSQARTITANFAIDQHTLTVVSAHGGESPGTTTADWGTGLSCYLTNSPVTGVGTQYVANGGSVAGNEFTPVNSTNVTLTLTNDATLTWSWATEYRLDTETNGAGSVDVADQWIASGSNVTINAAAAAHYHFTTWSGDTNGCTIAGSQITAPMTQARTITANFAIDQHTLTVVSAQGGESPGTTTVDWGTGLSCYLTNSPVTGVGTQYVANGGTVAGNEFTLVNSTNVTLTLTNDATLTWAWSTNYWLDTSTNGPGSVDVDDQWIVLGSNVVIQASPSPYYQFAGWSGETNGCTLAGSQITAPMTQPRAITASFAVSLAPLGTPEWWLALYGLTNQTPAQEELLDRDGDGMAAWKEYRADTIPTNSGSVLLITRIQKETGGFRIDWKGGVLATQLLERSSQLTGTSVAWSAMFTNPPPTSAFTNYLDTTATGPTEYYRIRIE